jgi:hypothetical protein
MALGFCLSRLVHTLLAELLQTPFNVTLYTISKMTEIFNY